MPIYNTCVLRFHENKLPLQQGRIMSIKWHPILIASPKLCQISTSNAVKLHHLEPPHPLNPHSHYAPTHPSFAHSLGPLDIHTP